MLHDTASGETRRLGRAGDGPDELGTAEGRVGVFDVARSRYLIFGADGELVESRSPSGFGLHDAGEGWALGVQTDDLGVETGRMYDLDRRGPGVSSARPRTRASPAGARRPG